MEHFAMRPFPFLLALGLTATIPTAAGAATWIWPDHSGTGPCAASLQACINSAAPGDTVLIGPDEALSPDAYTVIDETLSISKSLTLDALPGIDAVFAPNRRINVSTAASGPHVVAIRNLIFRRGGVAIVDQGTVSGSRFALERLRIREAPDPSQQTCALSASLRSPSPEIRISENHVDIGGPAVTTPFRYGICIADGSGASSVQTHILRNRIRVGDAFTETGISVGHEHAGGSATILANQISGPGLRYGIYVSMAPALTASATLRNNVVTFASDPLDGTGIRAEASNVTATNNTVVYGRKGLEISATSGRVANNLIAHNAFLGLSSSSGVSNGHNLFHANGLNTSGPTPGPGTVLADPLLASSVYPRPQSGSPAIDAGNNGDTPLLSFDVDGERRTVDTVDIGAYEASGDGAAVIEATTSNTASHVMFINPFPVPLTPGDKLVATAIRTQPPFSGTGQHLGIYLPSPPSGWALFHQNTSVPIEYGQRFAVMAPYRSQFAVEHVSDATTVSGNRSRINHASLNSLPDAIAVPMHRWESAYHDRPIGLSFTASRWHVRNEDGSAMPIGLKFNLAVAPLGSPNAFRRTVGVASASSVRLDHPLLDDNACAAPVVGRADDPDLPGEVLNPTRFSVEYRQPSGPGAPGRWFVVSEGIGSPTFPAAAAFHTLIHGPQANRCLASLPDPLFSNGFE